MESRSLGADTLFVNAGGMITMDGPVALDRSLTAIAVKDGRILGLGNRDSLAGIAASAQVVDLAGAIVMPGLIDSHNHFLGTALGWNQLQLAEVRSIDELLEAIKQRANSLDPGVWLSCSSRWHETNLKEKRMPTAQEIDKVAPHNPVYLPRGGHVVVTNSLGLKLAGIHEESASDPGGEYVRDAGGHLTGMLVERPAFSRLTALLPRGDEQARRAALKTGIATYNHYGITAVREPGLGAVEMRTYQAVVPELKALRASLMWRIDLQAAPEQRRAWIDGLAPVSGFGDNWLNLWGLKATIDGGVEGGYFRDAYANNPEFRGFPLTTQENIEAIIDQADGLGWRVGIHVVGDAAMDMALAAFKKANLRQAGHTFEHAFSPREGVMQMTKDLGLGVTLQHSLVYSLAGNMVSYWGRERAEDCTPSREWLDSGVLVGLGTDSPVTSFDPWLNIYGFATRDTLVEGVLGAEHRITVAEALKGYTVGSARVLGMQDDIGALTPGKLADFICLDQDPLTADLTSLAQTAVKRTVVNGDTVYSA